MNQIPRQLLKHSDEETAKEKAKSDDIQKRQDVARKAQSVFSREFGKSIGAEQITAAEKLLGAFETCEIAGNATASYDGISISSVTFGPKDGLPDKVLYAREFIRKSQAELNLVLSPYPLFSILQSALLHDLTPRQVGQFCARFAKKSWKIRRQQQVGVETIDTATAPVVRVWNRLRWS